MRLRPPQAILAVVEVVIPQRCQLFLPVWVQVVEAGRGLKLDALQPARGLVRLRGTWPTRKKLAMQV